MLHRKGAQMLVPCESFLVDKDSQLIDGQVARAARWGAHLAAIVSDHSVAA